MIDFESEKRKSQNLERKVGRSSRNLVWEMSRMGAILIGDDQEFSLHRAHPEVPKSLIFFNLRAIRGNPEVKKIAVDILEALVKPLNPELIADIPTGISHIASSLQDRLGVPIITPRLDGKSHAGSSIDGLRPEFKGKRVVMVDDVLSFGSASIPAVEILRKEDLDVTGLATVLSYEIGGEERLGKIGVPCVSALNAIDLLHIKRTYRDVSTDNFERAMERNLEIKEALRKYI